MWILNFEYLHSNFICDPNVSIANVVFISMANNHKKYEHWSFVLMVSCVYGNIMESFFCASQDMVTKKNSI